MMGKAVYINVKKNYNNILIYVCYAVIFTIISAVVFLPNFLNGNSLVWNIDGIGQYYPAFLYIGKWIRQIIGQIIRLQFDFPTYDLSIAMGENIIGSLNYYGLGDPLNFIAVFSNKENGAYIFTFMYMLRIFLPGISFIIYAGYMGISNEMSVGQTVLKLT